MKLAAVVSSSILLATFACQQPSVSPAGPHPTPVVVDTDLCDAAEAKLIELGCPEGRPTKRGERFGDVCRELQNAGIFVNPRCLSTLVTCAGVDVCTGTDVPSRS